MKLSPDQEEATQNFMQFLFNPNPGELVIEGCAGVGKSFLTKHLIETAEKSNEMIKLVTNSKNSNELNIHLTASTNKAADILQKMSGKETSTIHSLLSLKVFNNFSTGKTEIRQTASFTPIKNTLIIIDEASMINRKVLEIIRSSCVDCKVVYILDPYQLAPVKENSCPVTTDIKNKSTLTTIHRYKNDIAELADGFRKVLDGKPFLKIIGNNSSILRVNGPTFKQLIDEEFKHPDHDINSAKILSWSNAVVNQYNSYVRSLYTSSDRLEPGEFVVTNKPIISRERHIKSYKTDAILQIDGISDTPVEILDVQAWAIDIGERSYYLPVEPKDLTKALAKLKREANKTKDWVNYFHMRDTFVDLRPVHASTVHKSQGSTHDTVFINLNDIGRNRVPHEVARLMYVAITRASKKVVMHGKLGAKYNDE